MTNLARAKIYKLYSLSAYIIPMGVLFAVNSEAYIRTPASTFSSFGYIFLLFFIIACKSKLTEYSKKNTLMTFSIVMFIVAFIVSLAAQEIMFISGASVAGCLLATIFEKVADVYYGEAYEDRETKRRRKDDELLPQGEAWARAWGFR